MRTIPSKEQVEKAIQLIGKRGANYQYFFEKLNSPDWIKPLWESGFFFRSPPEPKYDANSISHSFWPESRYLARMAHVAPDIVLDILLKIPDTDNVRVHIDYIDAACSMPSTLAARWVDNEIGWVKNQQYLYLLLPDKYSKLIDHLATSGEIKTSLILAENLLSFVNEPSAAPDGKPNGLLDSELHARFDPWEYEQILKNYLPKLIELSGFSALNMLCRLLDSALYPTYHADRPEDFSYSWRPSIEGHDHDHSVSGLKSLLVSSIRDACEQLICKDINKIFDILNTLEERKWYIFIRIALYLICNYHDAIPEIVTSKLKDHQLFDEMTFRHEYYLLAKSCFSMLSSDDKQIILGWIDEGLDRKNVKERLKYFYGKEDIEEDEITRFILIRRRDKLAPFVDSLPLDWKSQYDEIVDKYGMPDHPEFVVYSSGGWVGPTSPKNVDELKAFSIEQLTDYLKTWVQPSGWATPSPEGLGRVLSDVVAAEPEKYAVNAICFKGLDPTYVRALLFGLREGIRQNNELKSWTPVLELCKWVISQPREIPERKSEYSDLDPGWVWARKAVSDLLSLGLNEGVSEIPILLRSLVCELIFSLLQDPEPAVDYEEKYGGSNMDPITISINTTRGMAMHALIGYALWVRRFLEKLPDKEIRISCGFGEMPEVMKALDNHLDIESDPALSVRAVYGEYFPQLVLLDKKWAISAIPRIFPSEERLKNYRDAAWSTYIVFCNTYDIVFEVLQNEYSKAIQRIGTISDVTVHLKDPEASLAEHLLKFYWQGKITLDEPGNFIERFFNKAQDKTASYAIEFLGRTLNNIEGVISPDFLKRLVYFWEWRFNNITAAESYDSHKEELAAFGWWFASRKFSEEWSLQELIKVMNLTGKIDFEHEVIKRFTELISKRPKQVLDCLSVMLNKFTWSVYTYKTDISTILSAALKIEEVEQDAKKIINRLETFGVFDFRDLLREGNIC